MKIRSMLLLVAGVGIGIAVARRLRKDDPEVLAGPAETRSSAHPTMHAMSRGAQRITDKATVVSLDAIRKARGAIRGRLGSQTFEDDATWN